MKRLETIVKEALADLHSEDLKYKDFTRNGVFSMEIAKAVDQLRRAEGTLRRAYDKENA